MLLTLVLFMSSFPTFAQDVAPIPCLDKSVFYQVLYGNEFVKYDPVSTNYTTIYTNSFDINAIGYNTLDNYIYGIRVNTNHLVKVGADGVFQDLGAVLNLPVLNNGTQSYFAGDFNDNGELFVTRSNINSVYKIDVANQAATDIPITSPIAAFPASDFTFSGGTFYGLDLDGDLFSFDETGTVSNLGPLTPAIPCMDDNGLLKGYGASFADNNGALYFFCNGSGDLFKVDLSDYSSSLLQSTGITLDANDGAACALADSLLLPKAIPCLDNSVFYQVLHGNEFVAYDPVTANYNLIYTNPYAINAIGYNTLDNFIYGIKADSNHLVRVGADGVFQDLGSVTNLPLLNNGTQSYFAGDFNDNGELFVTRSSINTVYKIDVNTLIATPIPITSNIATFPPSDFSFSGGMFYGLDSDGDLYSFDGAGAVSNLGPLNPAIPCMDAFGSLKGYGASFADNNGALYFFCNGSGDLFKVDLSNLQSTMIQSTGIILDANDGAACALSDSIIISSSEQVFQNEIKTFPNPTADFLTLQFAEPINTTLQYHILDLWGRDVQFGTLQQGGAFHRLSLKQLPDGVYFVEVGDNNQVFRRQKILKQTP